MQELDKFHLIPGTVVVWNGVPVCLAAQTDVLAPKDTFEQMYSHYNPEPARTVAARVAGK